MDLSMFNLGTLLDRPEYVQIKLSVIPQEVIDAYGLEKYACNGWVYFEITKRMYGLKQAGKLANKLLATRLFGHRYYQCAITPGLWRHKWRPVIFALIVDDFGFQYTNHQKNANHCWEVTIPRRSPSMFRLWREFGDARRIPCFLVLAFLCY